MGYIGVREARGREVPGQFWARVLGVCRGVGVGWYDNQEDPIVDWLPALVWYSNKCLSCLSGVWDITLLTYRVLLIINSSKIS